MARTDKLFDQGEERDLHPNFASLQNSPRHLAAKELIESYYARMGDPDGNFVREFRTNGFHSRLFEIACFAYLDSTGFSISRPHGRPDFMATKGDTTIGIEATAANPTAGQPRDISIAGMKSWSPEELQTNVDKEFPRRMVSVLTAKLSKRYDLLPHCQGKPLVFAVAPYFESGSVFHVDAALVPGLYETEDRDPEDDSSAPFFSIPGAESVSAVFYCNQFTVPRFLRMARQGTFKPDAGLVQGHAYVPDERGRGVLVKYNYRLVDRPKEDWTQGVTLFHNPFAEYPLQPGDLPCTSEFRVQEDRLRREVYDFHPLTSTMFMVG